MYLKIQYINYNNKPNLIQHNNLIFYPNYNVEEWIDSEFD